MMAIFKYFSFRTQPLLAVVILIGASSFDSDAADRQVSVWNYNGAIVSLEASGNNRQFIYVQPRQGSGAKVGDVLFEGSRAGNRYNGTAYISSDRCEKLGYAVSGQVSADQRQVVLSGMAPRRYSSCQVVRYSEDIMNFSFLRMENREGLNASLLQSHAYTPPQSSSVISNQPGASSSDLRQTSPAVVPPVIPRQVQAQDSRSFASEPASATGISTPDGYTVMSKYSNLIVLAILSFFGYLMYRGHVGRFLRFVLWKLNKFTFFGRRRGRFVIRKLQTVGGIAKRNWVFVSVIIGLIIVTNLDYFNLLIARVAVGFDQVFRSVLDLVVWIGVLAGGGVVLVFIHKSSVPRMWEPKTEV